MRLVDAAVVSRLAQANADKVRHAETPVEALNIAADAFATEADWVLEVAGIPGRTPLLAAKMVDLKSRSLLAVASSDELEPGGGSLPGAPAAPMDAERVGQKLLALLLKRLPAR